MRNVRGRGNLMRRPCSGILQDLRSQAKVLVGAGILQGGRRAACWNSVEPYLWDLWGSPGKMEGRRSVAFPRPEFWNPWEKDGKPIVPDEDLCAIHTDTMSKAQHAKLCETIYERRFLSLESPRHQTVRKFMLILTMHEVTCCAML